MLSYIPLIKYFKHFEQKIKRKLLLLKLRKKEVFSYLLNKYKMINIHKKEINIIFIGFWPTFNINDNIFLNVLKTRYDVKVLTEVNENTKIDLLLYSCFIKYN